MAYFGSGGTSKHKCYAVDTANGHLIWSAGPFSDKLGSPPTVANGVVYLGSKNGYVYALDASTGSQLLLRGPVPEHIADHSLSCRYERGSAG